jgi:hypothetical protein
MNKDEKILKLISQYLHNNQKYGQLLYVSYNGGDSITFDGEVTYSDLLAISKIMNEEAHE